MFRFFAILIVSLLCARRGGTDSIDELGEGLDLSVLEDLPEERPPSTGSLPSLHLFGGFEVLPPLTPPEDMDGFVVLAFPESPYLVAPNPARIDEAYTHMRDAINALDLKTTFPLKVVLHADGNVSVGLALTETVQDALPAGTDISPQTALRLAGVWTDIQVADKTHPLVLRAVVEVRKQARKRGLKLDTSEIYFLPVEPGNVFLGLRVQ